MSTAEPFAPSLRGLSTAEALVRRGDAGYNDIEDGERRALGRTLRSVAMEPMFLLLVIAAAIYAVIGDIREGLLLAFFALVTVGLAVFQERRSERALDALRMLAAPQVRVVRDGKVLVIPARELVPGDLFLLAEGDRVAADAVLRDAEGVTVDESLLSGESVPVRKVAHGGDAVPAHARPGGDDAPFVYASTLVVSGHGACEVLAIGRQTQVGALGASLATIDTAPTSLQQHMRRAARLFGLLALALSALLALWIGLVSSAWTQGVLAGIALGMATLPEEFPLVLTVFLALGAWRLARAKVLARRPAVVEALGAATLLCVDKTGTLTENRMRLRRLVSGTSEIDLSASDGLPEPLHRVLEFAVLSSRPYSADPIDRALREAGERLLAKTEHLHTDWSLAREYPLTPELLAVSHAWKVVDGEHVLAAKGAPEAVADLCHLSAPATAAVAERVRELAAQGLRVLAVASGRGPSRRLASRQHDYEFDFLGFVAFEDPLRPGVPAAVAQARSAGIAVAMITGDHAATALAIARQAGIDTRAGALAGHQLEALNDADLRCTLREVRVFARVLPEQKLRLVQAFQANGEIVAMTGDGVNDAPALKAADIGIAMGARGTEVARQAAGLVLLDDDFGHIVAGVRTGRRIFDNLRKVMTYITAIHVPIAGLVFIPVLVGLPPVMLPVHVVLTQMVIDPACSLAFEGAAEDPNLMRQPPRRGDAAVAGWPMLIRGAIQGGAVLLATLGVYLMALRGGLAEDTARALTFTGLTVGNLLLAGVNATAGLGWRALGAEDFRPFWLITALATLALAAALLHPGLREMMRFNVPDAADLAVAVVAVTLVTLLGILGVRRCLERP
ncbi:MAG: HAD-IC family P-type ATPase [Paucibacter sp.]|nr:HAD-IC family P-type ATPase [Roseateles sp.]